MSLSGLLFHASAYLEFAAPYAAAGALLIAVLSLIYAYSIHRRLRRLTLRKGDTLEDTLGELSRRAKEFQVFRGELEQYLKSAERRLKTSVRGVGLVRFNPFAGDGSGGNQSFVAAFLDENLNGVVFSGLYARGQTSVYAKPIQGGTSEFELTAEEKNAIERSKESLTAAAPELKK